MLTPVPMHIWRTRQGKEAAGMEVIQYRCGCIVPLEVYVIVVVLSDAGCVHGVGCSR